MIYYRGLFWYINNKLVTVKRECDTDGNFLYDTPTSLRGKQNLTHSEEWVKLSKDITNNKPFDYYPRGRVEIKNGKAKIFLNPDILTEEILSVIREEFGLEVLQSVKVIADNSSHYSYHTN